MNLITIPVKQGGVLAATVWERSDAKALVILHPATAVSQAFYKDFAEYLYAMGFNVLTYDYRGIGHSRSGTLQHCHVSMSDWIEQDVGCVTAWAKLRFPNLLLMGTALAGTLFCFRRPPGRCMRRFLLLRTLASPAQLNKRRKSSGSGFYYVFWRRFCVVPLAICLPDASGWGKIYPRPSCCNGGAGVPCPTIFMTIAPGMRADGQAKSRYPFWYSVLMTIPGLILQRLRACWRRWKTQKLNAARSGTRIMVFRRSATWAFFVPDVRKKYGLKSVAGWQASVNPRDNVFPAIFLIVEEINRACYAVTVGAQVSKRQQAHPGK